MKYNLPFTARVRDNGASLIITIPAEAKEIMGIEVGDILIGSFERVATPKDLKASHKNLKTNHKAED